MQTEKLYQHLIKAVVIRLSGRVRETDAPGEGSLELTVERLSKPVRLNCFMATESAYKFFIKEVDKFDLILAEFHLSGNHKEVEKTEAKVKTAELINYPEFMSNYYAIRGEIVNIRPHPFWEDSELAVLDCGFYIFARLTKSANLGVGDYIQTEGRLDVRVLGKVK